MSGPNETTEHCCPSSPASTGSVLLGIVGPSGIAYVTPRMTVSADLLEDLGREEDLEKRYRFADPCATTGCKHWSGRDCRLIDQVIESGEELGRESEASLPKCSIRASCQWFAQRGPSACRVCPLVITDRA
jgi:hypothetical protein